MINDDDNQYGTPREGTVLNMALTRSNPANSIEYPSDGILLDHPMTQEEHEAYNATWSSLRKQEWILEQRRRRNERCANITTVPGVPPYEQHRPTYALAANTGTRVDGHCTILMDIGGKINIFLAFRLRRTSRGPS